MALDVEKLKAGFNRSSKKDGELVLQDGDNLVRLLPPSIQYMGETKVGYIAYEFLMHYRLGPEGKNKEVCPKTILCNKSEDERLALLAKSPYIDRCPICEAVSQLYRTNMADDKALAGRLGKKSRYIFNAIGLKDKIKGIQILEVGSNVYKDLVKFITHPKWLDLLDLDTGRDVTITKINKKESKSGYEEYSVAPDPAQTSTREYLPKNYKEAIEKLYKSIPVAKTYEQLKAILEGGTSAVDIGAVKSIAVDEAGGGIAKEEDGEEPSADGSSASEAHSQGTASASPGPGSIQPTGKAPSCFPDSYGPRRAECVPCAFKVSCRDKFLES